MPQTIRHGRPFAAIPPKTWDGVFKMETNDLSLSLLRSGLASFGSLSNAQVFECSRAEKTILREIGRDEVGARSL